MHKATSKSNIEYTKTILPGVEIKRCSNTHQSYKQHLHSELSLGYVLNGKSTVTFGGEEFIYKKGDGVVIPPMLSHMCSPEDPSVWQIVMLYIDLDYYENGLSFTRAAKVSGAELKSVKEFVALIEGGAEDKNLLDAYLCSILSDVAAATQISSDTDKKGMGTAFVIYNHITKHFKNEITLASLEEMFGINKFSMIREFKARYNTTPLAFQLQLKTSEAKSMLDSGKCVMSIVSELGFYDQPHFIREFKKMSGLTPNAYLKSIGSNS